VPKNDTFVRPYAVPCLENVLNVNILPDITCFVPKILHGFETTHIDVTKNKTAASCLLRIFQKVGENRCAVRDLLVIIQKYATCFPEVALVLGRIFAVSMVGGYPDAKIRASWAVMVKVSRFWANAKWAKSPNFIKWINGTETEANIGISFTNQNRHTQTQNLVVFMLREFVCYMVMQTPAFRSKHESMLSMNDVHFSGYVQYTHSRMDQIRSTINNNVGKGTDMFADTCGFKAVAKAESRVTDNEKHGVSESDGDATITIQGIRELMLHRKLGCDSGHVVSVPPMRGKEMPSSSINDHLQAIERGTKLQAPRDVHSAVLYLCAMIYNSHSEEDAVAQLSKIRNICSRHEMDRQLPRQAFVSVLANLKKLAYCDFWWSVLQYLLQKIETSTQCAVNALPLKYKDRQKESMDRMSMPYSPPTIVCWSCYRIRGIEKHMAKCSFPRVYKTAYKGTFALDRDLVMRCYGNKKGRRLTGSTNHDYGTVLCPKVSSLYLLGQIYRMPHCSVALCTNCLRPHCCNFDVGHSDEFMLCKSCVTDVQRAEKRKRVTHACAICCNTIKRVTLVKWPVVQRISRFCVVSCEKEPVCNRCAWTFKLSRCIKRGVPWLVYSEA
jgi:hypothetical protein